MKKALLSFCLALGTLFWGAQAEAQFNKGGFTGPKDGTDVSVSVADAKNMKDEAYVTLKGKIVKKIGSEIGGRDHSTVLHGSKKISDEMKTSDDMRKTIEILQKKISPG